MVIAHKFGVGIWNYEEADELDQWREECYERRSRFDRWWG